MRTRAFEQDDAHAFCRGPNVENDVACFIVLLGEVYRDLGFLSYEVALATRRAARAGDDAIWNWSEAKLGDAGAAMRPCASINPGKGAFDGPKLEFAWRVKWRCRRWPSSPDAR
ncbi:hypothetical protein EDE08_12819 [Bradyrhizobium sp. R2.2-H]|nr:hypothetical protein EDE10_12827 [Bradyrhizobium sp. Y-H1]TCU63690.1 hypothetical protein EDE08_12819 [Bradyrhizobium sp. R2.2-H]